VYLISKVGDDTFGQLAKDTLVSQGVNTDFVYTAQAMHTGAVVTIVNSLGENMSCISPGANRALGTDELACAAAEQLIGSADLCLIHADLPYEAVATVIRLSSIYKTKIILETKLAVNDLNGIGNIDLPKEFYSVNILIPDLGDRYAVADVGAGDVHKLKRIGSELVARGMESVVMKMGMRGSFISDGEGTAHIPGFEVEMLDHTGCSDAFAGALAAACGSGDRLEKAVRFASAAGALACSKFGAQDSLPSKEQILTFLLDDPD
jgi:ribokinase